MLRGFVTLNGTPIPAKIPMSQLADYFPDGKIAGLRMRNPAAASSSSGGAKRSAVYLPKYTDSTRTVLDLSPESNGGATEYFFSAASSSTSATAASPTLLPSSGSAVVAALAHAPTNVYSPQEAKQRREEAAAESLHASLRDEHDRHDSGASVVEVVVAQVSTEPSTAASTAAASRRDIGDPVERKPRSPAEEVQQHLDAEILESQRLVSDLFRSRPGGSTGGPAARAIVPVTASGAASIGSATTRRSAERAVAAARSSSREPSEEPQRAAAAAAAQPPPTPLQPPQLQQQRSVNNTSSSMTAPSNTSRETAPFDSFSFTEAGPQARQQPPRTTTAQRQSPVTADSSRGAAPTSGSGAGLGDQLRQALGNAVGEAVSRAAAMVADALTPSAKDRAAGSDRRSHSKAPSSAAHHEGSEGGDKSLTLANVRERAEHIVDRVAYAARSAVVAATEPLAQQHHDDAARHVAGEYDDDVPIENRSLASRALAHMRANASALREDMQTAMQMQEAAEAKRKMQAEQQHQQHQQQPSEPAHQPPQARDPSVDRRANTLLHLRGRVRGESPAALAGLPDGTRASDLNPPSPAFPDDDTVPLHQQHQRGGPRNAGPPLAGVRGVAASLHRPPSLVPPSPEYATAPAAAAAAAAGAERDFQGVIASIDTDPSPNTTVVLRTKPTRHGTNEDRDEEDDGSDDDSDDHKAHPKKHAHKRSDKKKTVVASSADSETTEGGTKVPSKWVRDRADALRILLAGLCILLGICIAGTERDTWMSCGLRTMTRALRGNIIAGSPPLITDDGLAAVVGTHVYVAARAGLWESCVTASINLTEEGRLLNRWEDNLRHALRTVREGSQRSEDAAILTSQSTRDWFLSDSSTILNAVGFADALPVYQICNADVRDHRQCQDALGLTVTRMRVLTILSLTVAGILFVAIILDLNVVAACKIKVHKVVLALCVIFIWSMSLSVWILYVDSANVPAVAGSTHAECELEANLREALAAFAAATIHVSENATRFQAMIDARNAQSRNLWNTSELETLERMRTNLSVVPTAWLANRVTYWDDCVVGFTTFAWLSGWIIFTVIVTVYTLSRISSYRTYTAEQVDNASPFNPMNVFRTVGNYAFPALFGAPDEDEEDEESDDDGGSSRSGSDNDNDRDHHGARDDEIAEKKAAAAAARRGHRRGRGSKASGDSNSFLSQTINAGIDFVRSFAAPPTSAIKSPETFHQGEGGAGKSTSFADDQDDADEAARPPSPSSRNGPPPKHHRRRSSGNSSQGVSGGGSRGDSGWKQVLIDMVWHSAIEKVLPLVIGIPVERQKTEASRLIHDMFPEVPNMIVNIVTDYLVEKARQFVVEEAQAAALTLTARR